MHRSNRCSTQQYLYLYLYLRAIHIQNAWRLLLRSRKREQCPCKAVERCTRGAEWDTAPTSCLVRLGLGTSAVALTERVIRRATARGRRPVSTCQWFRPPTMPGDRGGTGCQRSGYCCRPAPPPPGALTKPITRRRRHRPVVTRGAPGPATCYCSCHTDDRASWTERGPVYHRATGAPRCEGRAPCSSKAG